MERGHHAPAAVVRRVDRRQTQACREHAVERGRGAAPLDVTEHGGPRLEPGPRLDLVFELDADSAQPRVAELVELALGDHHRALLRSRPLGRHHDREVPAARVTAADQPAHLVDVEGNLRDQDHVGTPGDARVQRDPARVAAHHFDDKDPVMALGGRVEAVDRLRGDVQRGVEAEGDIGRAEVVINRLRHADDVDAVGVQATGGTEGVLAADRGQAVEVEVADRRAHALEPVLALIGIGPGAAEDRAAAREDPPDSLEVELGDRAFEDAAPAVAEAHDLMPVVVDSLTHHAADDGVQPGTVTPTGQDSDAH